jgi:hypothetical protein
MVMQIPAVEIVAAQSKSVICPILVAAPGLIHMSKKVRKRFRKSLMSPMTNFGKNR